MISIIPTCRSTIKLQLSNLIFRNLCSSKQKTFSVGQFVTVKEKITQSQINTFAKLSGDFNPIHTDKATALKHKSDFKDCVVHGAYLNSLVSKVIGTKLPGEGCVVVKQTLNFPAPCYAEEEVLIKVSVKELRKIITLDFECSVSNDNTDLLSENKKVVLFGEAKVLI